MVVINFALDKIGYTETDDNNTLFGKWYGMNNQPWCAMFVSWCFNQVGEADKVAASTKKGFASCDAGLKWFAKKGKLIPVGQAEQGDIVFFQFDTDAQPDHVGLVYANNKRTKTLICIEGNTSADNKGSQSNGGGVYRKKRSYATVMATVRP
jgi:cell wall-associated NlpC family hydrolase